VARRVSSPRVPVVQIAVKIESRIAYIECFMVRASRVLHRV
jgi:hypothetical protein